VIWLSYKYFLILILDQKFYWLQFLNWNLINSDSYIFFFSIWYNILDSNSDFNKKYWFLDPESVVFILFTLLPQESNSGAILTTNLHPIKTYPFSANVVDSSTP